MQLFFIQFGKVLSSMRNDGVILALGRVWSGIWSMIRPIGSGKVLLISGGIGDSARYRTKHVAELLRNNGIVARYASQGNFFIYNSIQKFQVFVFHRVFMDDRMRAFVQAIKREEKMIIFETDDITFDFVTFRKTNAYESMNVMERKQYEGGLGTELLRDPFVHLATTTTGFLAKKLRMFGKETFVVPNVISEKDVRWADVFKNKRKQKDTDCVLGYFSGTKSHDRDFASIAPALIEILRRYKNVQLRIVGHLTLGNEFSGVSHQITRLPFASRKWHFYNIASVDINLAPLEVNDAFCEAKSELKWIEAGIVEVPTVASSTQTFREAIIDGEDGFVAKNNDEWVDKLSQLIENKSLRRKVGITAKERILDEYTTKSDRAREYVRVLKKIRSIKKKVFNQ